MRTRFNIVDVGRLLFIVNGYLGDTAAAIRDWNMTRSCQGIYVTALVLFFCRTEKT
ncbi:MAG: hypothetical protein F6K16_40365 [Symploca sp. SIO2B6]|nr:hypothetical protein [Symploca sp. SIO2B6]